MSSSTWWTAIHPPTRTLHNKVHYQWNCECIYYNATSNERRDGLRDVSVVCVRKLQRNDVTFASAIHRKTRQTTHWHMYHIHTYGWTLFGPTCGERLRRRLQCDDPRQQQNKPEKKLYMDGANPLRCECLTHRVFFLPVHVFVIKICRHIPALQSGWFSSSTFERYAMSHINAMPINHTSPHGMPQQIACSFAPCSLDRTRFGTTLSPGHA